MRLLFIFTTVFICGISNSFAQDYLYFKSGINCKLSRYQNGKFKEISGDQFTNTPLELEQFARHPTLVKFKSEGAIYIASTLCIYLSHDTTPKKQNIYFEKDLNEIESTLFRGKFSLEFNYMFGQASFDDRLFTGVAGIKTQQNSPAILGFVSKYQFDQSPHSLIAGANYSIIKMAQISDATGASTNFNLPIEINYKIYLQHSFSENNFSIFEGIDYASFSSFNSWNYVQNQNDLGFINNKIVFATVGLGKFYNIYEKLLTTKLSFGKVINSIITPSTNTIYSGYRFHFSGTLKGVDKINYNFIYSKDILTFNTKLLIDRIGLGIGYELF